MRRSRGALAPVVPAPAALALCVPTGGAVAGFRPRRTIGASHRGHRRMRRSHFAPPLAAPPRQTQSDAADAAPGPRRTTDASHPGHGRAWRSCGTLALAAASAPAPAASARHILTGDALAEFCTCRTIDVGRRCHHRTQRSCAAPVAPTLAASTRRTRPDAAGAALDPH